MRIRPARLTHVIDYPVHDRTIPLVFLAILQPLPCTLSRVFNTVYFATSFHWVFVVLEHLSQGIHAFRVLGVEYRRACVPMEG